MQRLFPLVLWGLALVAFNVAADVPAIPALATGATFAISTAAGAALIVRWLERSVSGPAAIAAFGGIIGLVATRLLLLVGGSLIGRGLPLFALTFGFLAMFGLAHGGRLTALLAQGRKTSSAGPALGFAAIVTVLLALPFATIGAPTDLGFEYLPYFNKDFFNHVAVIAELARDSGPQNPYAAGATLHYYWFSHLWPASIVGLTGTTAQQALSATVPYTLLLVVSSFMVLLNSLVHTVSARNGATAVAFVAYSYVGWLYLGQQIWTGLASAVPGGGVLPYSFLSHSWFRDFLYEPHAATALGILVLLVHVTGRGSEWSAAAGVIYGAAAGSTLLTDSFLGLVAVTWFCIWCAVRWWSSTTGTPALLAAGAASVFLPLGIFVGIFPSEGSGQPLELGIHPLAKILPAYYAADLGPLFVVGLAGVYRAAREHTLRPLVPALSLGALALLFGMLVQMSIYPDIVLRKATKIVMLPAAILVGVALTPGFWSASLRRGMVALCVAGVISLATDLYQHAAVGRSAFPPSTLVSPDRLAIYHWMRTATPPTTVFQLLDAVRPDREFLSTSDTVMHGISERRTLFGNYEMPYLFHAPHSLLEDRREVLSQVYVSDSGARLHSLLLDLPPHLLVVDETEPGPARAVKEAVEDGRLREVFRSGRVAVFEISD